MYTSAVSNIQISQRWRKTKKMCIFFYRYYFQRKHRNNQNVIQILNKLYTIANSSVKHYVKHQNSNCMFLSS